MWYWLSGVVPLPVLRGQAAGPLSGSAPVRNRVRGSPAISFVAHSFLDGPLGLIQVLRVCALLEITAPSDEGLAVTNFKTINYRAGSRFRLF